MTFACAIYRIGGPQGSFGGPLGVLGVLWGSRGVRGRPGKGWGGPREDPGGSWAGLENRHFLFVVRWICQRSNEILMFSVLSDFVRRSVVIAVCYFSIVFGSLLFAKQ